MGKYSIRLKNIQKAEEKPLDELFSEVVSEYKSYTPEKNQELGLLKKAFEFGKNIHKNQERDSGVPYFTHPLLVAQILQYYEVDATMLIATMLHDAIEDSEEDDTQDQIKKLFGEEILNLIDGVSKVGEISGKNSHHETLQKIFTYSSDDARILIIKIADRIHNISTIGFKNGEEKRKKKIAETLEVYVSAAEKLALDYFKYSLLNACFFYLFPEKFSAIEIEVEKKEEKAKKIFSEISQEIKEVHPTANIQYVPYEIGKFFQWAGDVSDIKPSRLFYIDVVTGSQEACYQSISWLSSKYHHKTSLLKDCIANPAENGYEAIKTSLVVHNSYLIRFHLLTEEMKQKNAKGIFDQFKQDGYSIGFIENFSQEEDAQNFVEILQNDALSKKICVHHPEKGQKYIPIYSSVLDAVIHFFPEQFVLLKKIEKNGESVPFHTTIEDNDIIECTFNMHEHIDISWMNFLTSSFGKTKLQNHLKTREASQKYLVGKKLLQDAFDQFKEGEISDLMKKNPAVYESFYANTREELYVFVAEGMVTTDEVLGKYEELKSRKLTMWSRIKKIFSPSTTGIVKNSLKLSFSSTLDPSAVLKKFSKKCEQKNIVAEKVSLSQKNNMSRLTSEVSAEHQKDLFEFFSILRNAEYTSHIVFLPALSFYIKIFLIAVLPFLIALFTFLVIYSESFVGYYQEIFFTGLVSVVFINAFIYLTISRYFPFFRKRTSFLLGSLFLNILTFSLFAIILYNKTFNITANIYIILALFSFSIFINIFLFIKNTKIKISKETSNTTSMQIYLAYFFGIFSAFIWGVNPLAIRVMMESGEVGPLFIASFRLLGGGLALLFITSLFYSKKIKKQHLPFFKDKIAILIATVLMINFMLFQWGIKYTTATNANLIENFIPIIVLLFILTSRIFQKERKWILEKGVLAFAVVFIGSVGASLIISSKPEDSLLNPDFKFLGNLIEVVAMFFFAAYVYLNSFYLKKHSHVHSLFFLRDILIFSGVLSIPFFLIFEFIPTSFSSTTLLLLLFVSIVSTSIAYLSWNYAARHLNLISNSLLLNFSIIVTLVVEFLIYDDELSFLFFIGFLCILISSFFARKIE